jgi:hypothetical protein
MKLNVQRKTGYSVIYAFVILGTVIVVSAAMTSFFGGNVEQTVLAQQDPFLSRRIDQIEQRFYMIESRLNRIEQQSTPTLAAPRIPNNSDTELPFLRSQIDSLRTRLGEAECALLRLDERTLTPAARQARRRAADAGTDRCRLDPTAPLQLSARP